MGCFFVSIFPRQIISNESKKNSDSKLRLKLKLVIFVKRNGQKNKERKEIIISLKKVFSGDIFTSTDPSISRLLLVNIKGSGEEFSRKKRGSD